MSANISGVYAIVNTIDNKAYIGSSMTIQRRWSEHRRLLQRGTHPNSYLQRAYNKYGVDAFDYRILEIVGDKAALGDAEQRWIMQWDTLTRAHGYNIRPETTPPTHSPETRQKMSDAQKGRKHSPETIQKMSATQKGRIITPETRQKMSAAKKGSTITPETRQKISEAGKRRYESPEERQKTSNAQKGRIITPEHRQKLSDSGKASRATPEAR